MNPWWRGSSSPTERSKSAVWSPSVQAPMPTALVDCVQTIEADVSRWKRVIGDALRSRTDGRQATEVAIAVQVLNRMLDLGRPEYVRVA